MRIREAVLEDAEALTEVHVASWRVGYNQILPEQVIENMCAQRLERWRKNLSEVTEFRKILCEVDGRVAGFAVYSPSRDADRDRAVVAELCAIYVHPDFWRHGCGGELMDDVLQRVRQGGWREINVWMLEGNTRADAFYTRCGFKLDGQSRMIDFAGEKFAEVRFARPVVVPDDAKVLTE